MVEPESALAISMCALLCLGGLAQYMQSRGGKLARAAPVIVLSLLLLISASGMLVLSGSLSSSSDWRAALVTGEAPEATT